MYTTYMPDEMTIKSPCGCSLTRKQAETVRGLLHAAIRDERGGARKPKSLRPCPHCRRKFGARELVEHIAACPKNRAHEQTECPRCGRILVRFNLPRHLKSCPGRKGEG